MTDANDRLSIRNLRTLPEQIRGLETEAVAEGFKFLTRLISEWENRSNRFDQSGECLLGVFRHGQLIAIGGVSRDPYGDPKVGRLRRVYVARAMRGQNVGKVLVKRLLKHAAPRFQTVRLSTDTAEGARFYLRCGFQPVEADGATHEKSVTPGYPTSG